jgi:tetratricopeptide (TPR) repeat protein
MITATLSPLLRRAFSLAWVAAWLGASCTLPGVDVQVAAADRTPSANEPSIAQLIERLGAPQYAQREKAREQIQQLGVRAFEALHAAQQHADVEIRKQAEYLLRAIRISWVQDDDSDEVKGLLERYQQEEYDGREEVLQQLGRIDHGQSLTALCRLTRFETSEELSKRAALTVMRYDLAEQQVDPAQLTEQIVRALSQSERAGAEWLRTYARSLHDPPATLDKWNTLVAQEIQDVQQHPDKNRLAIARDLLRWQIEMLQDLGHHPDMLLALKQLLPLQGETRDDLLRTINWLLEREAWPLVDELVKAYPQPFRDDAFLLYRRAEAALRRGQPDEAQALAGQAIAKKADDEPFLHVELGLDLQNRGMIDWAEREYRHTIETFEQDTHPPVEAAIRLGWMFHDLARYREAYDTFKQLVELMSKDKDVVRRVQELNRLPVEVQGQMHFSRALELAELQRWDEHRAELETALKNDRDNADILIAMDRVPDADEQWRKKTERRIELLREEYAQEVARAERDAKAVPGLATNRLLAQALNQYAWLVSNTSGDYEHALQCSQRSLELLGEEAGYLDTLARCYYALGDYAAAVKHQRRAVALEPHTGQIRRQMELFETTLKEQGPGKPQRPTPVRTRSSS